MRLVFLDLKTGKTHAPATWNMDIWWWAEGNGDDCNRILACDETDDDDYDHDCIGATRFIAVDLQDAKLGEDIPVDPEWDHTLKDAPPQKYALGTLDYINSSYPDVAQLVVRAWHGVSQ